MSITDRAWRLLVVEDEALIAEETADRLTRMGHEVVGIADTGREAIDMAQDHRPDLVLMDIQLKGRMTGIEAAQQIYDSLGTPVVFASAHSDRETLQRAQTNAQFGYILKPFRENDLTLALRVAMHRHHVETHLRKTELTHAAILASINDCVIVANAQGRICFMNLKAEELLGWHALESFDRPLEQVVPLVDESGRESIRIGRTLPDGYTCMLTNRNGHALHVEITVTPIEDAVHREIGTTVVLKDVTDKKRKDALIWRQANFDDLTGLPNRGMFRDRLRAEMLRAEAAQLPVALLLLDLDHFKEVNDTLGHEKGDELLAEAARRIQGCLRHGDLVARLGGDEFGVILPGMGECAPIEQLAARITRALAEPLFIGNVPLHVEASMGIAVFPRDAQAYEDLVKYADQAMYAAKSEGRNRFAHFTHAIRARVEHHEALMRDLRQALARGQLQVHYQPIVALRTGEVAKAEALLRWHHPQHGMVSPLEFIPLAEESGLIHEIGDWVFGQAADALAQLGRPLQISVNASAKQLASPHFGVAHWGARLDALGIARQSISLEITESALVEDSPQVRQCLTDFRTQGIEVSIDDFGTGFSSLAYLKKFDIDYLKVDASFVRGLAHDENDRIIVEAIIVMAHKLGIKTIAEGVETPEQRAILGTLQCDYAQGYLFSRPVPLPEFERFLAHAGS